MGDVYKEQLVRKQSGGRELFLRIAAVVTAVMVSFASFILLPRLTLLITAAACFGVYYFMSMLNVEYEYILTNDTFDIDCIYNKSRRKSLFSGSVRDFESFLPLKSVHDEGQNMKTIDCSSGASGGVKYCFITTHKDTRTRFIIEPNPVLLEGLKKKIPTLKQNATAAMLRF